MKFKSLLSILLIGIIICTCCYPIPTFAVNDYSYKIDSTLLDILKKTNNNDTICVSVWLNSIDYSAVENKLIKKIGDNISKEIIDIVNSNDTWSNDISFFNKERKKTALELKRESQDIQTAIEARRKIIATMQFNNNKKILDELFKGKIKSNDLVFISKYVPNVELNLTKEQINNIISYENIEKIYYRENIINNAFSINERLNKLAFNEENYQKLNKDIYDATGITELKNTYNLTGAGVKVGNIDWYLPKISYTCFKDAIKESRLICYPDTEKIIGDNSYNDYHQRYTTGEIIGKIDGKFEGISPNVNMYCVETGNPNYIINQRHEEFSWKDKIELLIDSGANIINASMNLLNSINSPLNQYDDSSKWIDAIININNITFIQSAGNGTINQIIKGGMAYNSITVGYYNIATGNIYENLSSYNSGNGVHKQYKPDIAAPGDLTVYYTNEEARGGGGTSGSAPIVTGIAALLCEKYPILKTTPMLLKALLLNGAIYQGEKNVANSIENFVAFDRKSGAGFINGEKSLKCYMSFNWHKGLFNANLPSNHYEYNINITNTNNLVHVTICGMKMLSFKSNVKTKYNDYGTPNFKITVKKELSNGSQYLYTSSCTNDTKCSVVFKPPVTGNYKITVTRTDPFYYYDVPFGLSYITI